MIDFVYNEAVDLAIEKWEGLPDIFPKHLCIYDSMSEGLKRRIDDFCDMNGLQEFSYCTLCSLYHKAEWTEDGDIVDTCKGCIIANTIGGCTLSRSPYEKYIEGETSKAVILNCLYDERLRLETEAKKQGYTHSNGVYYVKEGGI
jgi:hypothetical protein